MGRREIGKRVINVAILHFNLHNVVALSLDKPTGRS